MFQRTRAEIAAVMVEAQVKGVRTALKTTAVTKRLMSLVRTEDPIETFFPRQPTELVHRHQPCKSSQEPLRTVGNQKDLNVYDPSQRNTRNDNSADQFDAPSCSINLIQISEDRDDEEIFSPSGQNLSQAGYFTKSPEQPTDHNALHQMDICLEEANGPMEEESRSRDRLPNLLKQLDDDLSFMTEAMNHQRQTTTPVRGVQQAADFQCEEGKEEQEAVVRQAEVAIKVGGPNFVKTFNRQPTMPPVIRSHEKASTEAYQRLQYEAKFQRRSSIKSKKDRCRALLTPIKVECIENEVASQSYVTMSDSSSDNNNLRVSFCVQQPNFTQDQDYIKLKNLTLEKMVLTKRISRKVARNERLAELNSKIHHPVKGDRSFSLSVHKRKSSQIYRSQPKKTTYALISSCSPLTPFKQDSQGRKQQTEELDEIFEMQPQAVPIVPSHEGFSGRHDEIVKAQQVVGEQSTSSCGKITHNFKRIKEVHAQQRKRQRQIRQLVNGPKTAEEIENSVRSKAIRHLIWLGNLLRHGDEKKMDSSEHQELLEAIGSQNSPNTAKSLSSNSDLSSLNFNLSHKHQVQEVPGEGGGDDDQGSERENKTFGNGNSDGQISVKAALNYQTGGQGETISPPMLKLFMKEPEPETQMDSVRGFYENAEQPVGHHLQTTSMDYASLLVPQLEQHCSGQEVSSRGRAASFGLEPLGESGNLPISSPHFLPMPVDSPTQLNLSEQRREERGNRGGLSGAKPPTYDTDGKDRRKNVPSQKARESRRGLSMSSYAEKQTALTTKAGITEMGEMQKQRGGSWLPNYQKVFENGYVRALSENRREEPEQFTRACNIIGRVHANLEAIVIELDLEAPSH